MTGTSHTATTAAGGQTTPPHDVPTEGRISLCIVVTADITIQNLCRGRLEYLTQRGFDVTVVCGPTNMAGAIEKRGVRLYTAPLTRAVTPWTDLRCVRQLRRFFKREQFDIIEVSTPKAALVASLAAWLAGAPRVVHLIRGLAYQKQGRLRRRLLRWSQRLPCRLAHHVISVSHSIRQQAYEDGLCAPGAVEVLGHGSSNGVDLVRFSPALRNRRDDVRNALGLPMDAVVIGFVGRMTVDKGIVELIEAFTSLRDDRPDLYLLLVGDYETGDRPPERTVSTIADEPHIRHVGWQSDTSEYYGAMDLLALPSHREGFCNVLLESLAAEVPAVATDIPGCRDVVHHGTSGLLVPLGDVRDLAAAIKRLVEDVDLRFRMGRAGRAYVEQHFDQQYVWAEYERLYRGLCES